MNSLSHDGNDLWLLIEMCKDYCALTLASTGCFPPFAAFMTPNGSLRPCRIPTGKPETSAFELAAKGSHLLFQELNAGRACAVAMATQVWLPNEIAASRTPGIRIDLTTAEEGRTLYLPYQIKREGFLWRRRAVVLGDPREVPALTLAKAA